MADIRDTERVAAALAGGDCEAIVHMAALAEVAESVAFPERYHDVNVAGTEAVLEAALRAGVSRLVFSSTAAVYGAPERIPIDEDSPLAPANPYGETKLAAERLLGEAAAASGGRLATVALRYFNAAGADGPRGEDHAPESHLVPLALAATRDGTTLKVFGDDYPTPDGTCVRDYVHVSDLAAAHVAALEAPAAVGRGVQPGHRQRELRARGAAGGRGSDRPQHRRRARPAAARRPAGARGLERPRPATCWTGDRNGGSTTSSPTPGRGCPTTRAATTTEARDLGARAPRGEVRAAWSGAGRRRRSGR